MFNAQVAEELRAELGAALGAIALEWSLMNVEPTRSVDVFLGALPRTEGGYVRLVLPSTAQEIVLYAGAAELVRALLRPAN